MKNSLIVITGASSGIGAATAKAGAYYSLSHNITLTLEAEAMISRSHLIEC